MYGFSHMPMPFNGSSLRIPVLLGLGFLVWLLSGDPFFGLYALGLLFVFNGGFVSPPNFLNFGKKRMDYGHFMKNATNWKRKLND